MAEVKLAAETRTEFGKGAARRIRRDSKVPAVVYGHGADPVHITLPGHELQLALRTPNVLLSLEIDGKTQLAIPKAVQRDAIKGFLDHVDLLLVKRGEKVNVEVYVHTEGELAPGAYLLEHVLSTLNVEAEATHIPESVTVSIAGLEWRGHPRQGHPAAQGHHAGHRRGRGRPPGPGRPGGGGPGGVRRGRGHRGLISRHLISSAAASSGERRPAHIKETWT